MFESFMIAICAYGSIFSIAWLIFLVNKPKSVPIKIETKKEQ